MQMPQLDILALEPFYGGERKSMLETILRFSRHRWTVLKLPPRRIERRLAAAAHWFGEQISRHWSGHIDVLFCSEAMNLADLLRFVPELATKPSVVYFHDNQLPPIGSTPDNPLQVVNISTAAAATEVWFNSHYHKRTFLRRAKALVEQLPELAGHDPVPEVTDKAAFMPPPVDQTLSQQIIQSESVVRDPRTIFVDTRNANTKLLNEALTMLHRREKYKLITVGPVEGLTDDLPRRTIAEDDEPAQIRALHEAFVVVSGRPYANYDHHAVRGLLLGCWPIFPNAACYPELLPKSLHPLCLYDTADADRLVTQLQNSWWIEQPAKYKDELFAILTRFDAVQACQAMDDRLEQLAIAYTLS
ncbi:MAG: DUF3524 domain-containing protein [Planctomycetota bacterium]|nr:DUF3524 domain-containing protein [Planctomycetota bacterium]